MSDEIELIPERDFDPAWWASLMANYTGEINADEMRRFISVWVCVESGAIPEKIPDTAQKIERFLKGSGPRAVE